MSIPSGPDKFYVEAKAAPKAQNPPVPPNAPSFVMGVGVRSNRNKSKEWKVVAVVIGVTILAIAGAANESAHPSQDPATVGSGGSATDACHAAVSSDLTAPATAHFHDEQSSDGAFGGVTITGEVDSENSFGALLTSSYTCDVDANGTVTSVNVG
jgi:hypothetical protein